MMYIDTYAPHISFISLMNLSMFRLIVVAILYPQNAPKLSSELLEGVTCSKKGLKLLFSHRPNFGILSHLVREIQLFEKGVFS